MIIAKHNFLVAVCLLIACLASPTLTLAQDSGQESEQESRQASEDGATDDEMSAASEGRDTDEETPDGSESSDADRGTPDADVLMFVNSGDNQVQGMAMTLASNLSQQDESVHIVLCGDAAELGLEEFIPEALAPRNVSSKELMQEAMSFGATVQVCHLFLPNSGYRQYEEEDLLQEVTVNDPEEQAEMLSEDDPRVLTF
ncbi:MAG: DsrE family protein [Ectothiorhodospiraceae bacterium]